MGGYRKGAALTKRTTLRRKRKKGKKTFLAIYNGGIARSESELKKTNNDKTILIRSPGVFFAYFGGR